MQLLLVLAAIALATVNAAPTPGLISFRDWDKENVGKNNVDGLLGEKCVLQLGFDKQAEVVNTCATGYECKPDEGYSKDKLDRGRFYWTGKCVRPEGQKNTGDAWAKQQKAKADAEKAEKDAKAAKAAAGVKKIT
jgi:hypothetical protein